MDVKLDSRYSCAGYYLTALQLQASFRTRSVDSDVFPLMGYDVKWSLKRAEGHCRKKGASPFGSGAVLLHTVLKVTSHEWSIMETSGGVFCSSCMPKPQSLVVVGKLQILLNLIYWGRGEDWAAGALIS